MLCDCACDCGLVQLTLHIFIEGLTKVLLWPVWQDTSYNDKQTNEMGLTATHISEFETRVVLCFLQAMELGYFPPQTYERGNGGDVLTAAATAADLGTSHESAEHSALA